MAVARMYKQDIDEFETFLNVTRSQFEILTPVASGGIVIIALTYLYVKGYREDTDFGAFKLPSLLVIPLGLFVATIATGYLASYRLQQFAYEVTFQSMIEKEERQS